MLNESLRQFAQESQRSGATLETWIRAAFEAWTAVPGWNPGEYSKMLMKLAEHEASQQGWTAEQFGEMAGRVWAQSLFRLRREETNPSKP